MPAGTTDMERRVVVYKRTARQQTIARLTSQNTVVFREEQVVSLKIPGKLRLPKKASRIAARISKISNTKRYTLICEYGWLKHTYPHSNLNPVPKHIELEYSLFTGIPELDFYDCLKSVSLNQAVQQTNNRGSINAAQKGGRKACRTTNLSPVLSPEPTVALPRSDGDGRFD